MALDPQKLEKAVVQVDRLSQRLDRCERWLDRDDARRDAELAEEKGKPMETAVPQ